MHLMCFLCVYVCYNVSVGVLRSIGYPTAGVTSTGKPPNM